MRFFCLLFISLFLSSFLKAQVSAASFMHDGEEREFFVYLPTTYTEGSSLPLVINMHGFGSNNTEQLGYSSFNLEAEANNFIVIYPQGLYTALIGTGGNHWNADWNTGVDDVGFINKIIDWAYTAYDVNLSRVYATGMSNGGYMSYTLACSLSDRIAAIASVTGAMTVSTEMSCNPGRAIPVMQIHGTSDATVPYTGTVNFNSPIPDIVNWWRTNNNCSAAVLDSIPDTNFTDNTTVNTSHSECEDNTDVVFYTINGGGHTWPGAFVLNPLLFGYTNLDFNATEHIWDFFDNYVHPSPAAGTVLTSSSSIVHSNSLLVSPNPFTSHLNIEIKTSERVRSYQIVDIHGRILLAEENPISLNSVNTESLNAGVYFLRVETEADIYSTRLIKQ